MKTEYMLTTAQKAEIEDIDRQIHNLLMRKYDIYTNAHCRYVFEMPEDNDFAESLEKWKYYGINPIISKEGIVKIITSEPSERSELKE